jgi:hypothetical protein
LLRILKMSDADWTAFIKFVYANTTLTHIIVDGQKYYSGTSLWHTAPVGMEDKSCDCEAYEYCTLTRLSTASHIYYGIQNNVDTSCGEVVAH